MAPNKLFLVIGIGDGSGTGASSARLFAKNGYSVAIVARNAESVEKLAKEIKQDGGDAAGFPLADYKPASISSLFSSVTSHYGPSTPLRVALFNAGWGAFKPFLQTTPEEVQESVDTNIVAAFTFAREAILKFKELDLDEKGKRGTLLFTGATAAWRGGPMTSAFAPGKMGIRAISQGLNKEFGKENIHVAHSIIDGGIRTTRSKGRVPPEKLEDIDAMLEPDSIANAYLYLVQQDRTAWTWELDLRPAHEKW